MRTPIKKRSLTEQHVEEATRNLRHDIAIESRRQAIDAAVKFRKTKEGTMSEAFQHVLGEKLERNRNRALLKRTGYRRGVDSPEGRSVIEPDEPEPFAKRRRAGATVTGIKRNTSPV